MKKQSFNGQEVEALLLMFGKDWQSKFKSLDGQNGRPTLSDCIHRALEKINAKQREDLVEYIECYLENMAKNSNVVS